MRENLLLYPVSSFNLGSQNHWLAMPIDNYREDVMLFSSSDSRILGLIWNGNENLQIIKNFTQLICNRGNEYLK